MRVEEQTKRVQEMNEIVPRNVGTCDVKQAFLSRPIDDPNKFCSNPKWNASIEEEFDQLNNIAVLAANAETEDVNSAVDQDSERKKGASDESDEGSDMFNSDDEQTSEWSHGKPTNATDNVNWTTVSKSVSLLKSRRSECKTGRGQQRMWNELDMEFQCLDKGNERKLVTVNNQEGKFGKEEIDLEVEDKNGLNLFKRQVDGIRYPMELSLSNNARPLTEQGLELLKRSDIWIGDTGATMHSSFCSAHGINKRATTLSTTGVSGDSIKSLPQMDLNCIAINKDGNAVGPV
jgi:hypothetical protein